MGFFDKIKAGLTKTRDALSATLGSVFTGFSEIDDDFYDELEECLILADLGVETATKAVEKLRKTVREQHLKTTEEAKVSLKEILTAMLEVGSTDLDLSTTPSVVLVIGVNGVGKTTTIGKLANMLKNEGKKVIIAAADTFRAAAIEQVEIWAQRSDIDLVKHRDGSDPAAVVFDAVQAAKARGADVVICDTAGRLHNKKNLMDELAKIARVADRELPGCDRETLLVVDATTGQNAVEQAKNFKEATDITGVVLTKLDSTAKGGVTIAVKEVTGVPVKLVGLGEQIDDLKIFDPADFAKALIE